MYPLDDPSPIPGHCATREIETLLGDLDDMPREIPLRSDSPCVQGRRRFERASRDETDAASGAARTASRA